MEKKLYRNEYNKMIGGVCSGLAGYLAIDPTIVRLVFLVLLFLGHGAGFVMYIILLVVLPKRGVMFNDPNFKPGVDFKDYRVPPTQPFSQPFGEPFTPPFNFAPVPPKKTSNASVIFGVVLVVLGTLFLIDELDFIPDWDFDKLWPVILVAAGAAIIVTGKKKQPWEQPNWSATTVEPAAEEPAAPATTEKTPGFDLSKKTDEPSNDNPTTL